MAKPSIFAILRAKNRQNCSSWVTRKPKIATSHGVEVAPKVAPTITPTACSKLTKPALTKPMTVSVVAVEDWLATVTRAPENHRAQSAGDEGLQGAAQRVAGKALQALGEVMDLRAERGRSRRRAKSRRRCSSNSFSPGFAKLREEIGQPDGAGLLSLLAQRSSLGAAGIRSNEIAAAPGGASQ
jgi:hypothetical protein